MKYKLNNKDRLREAKSLEVTLPVSDTVPAPGNYTVTVMNMDGAGVPVVNSTDLINNIGAGTAEDVSSSLRAPQPGREEDETP